MQVTLSPSQERYRIAFTYRAQDGRSELSQPTYRFSHVR